MSIMQELFRSYGLNPRRFTYLLGKCGAVMGGSSAMYMYMETHAATASDIDIYVRSGTDMAAVTEYMAQRGYKGHYSILGDYIHVKYITGIMSFIHEGIGRMIQIITVDMDPVEYITEYTDLSCCAVAYDFKRQTFQMTDPGAFADRLMYVKSEYFIAYDSRNEKLRRRIEKYKARGFTFMGKE